MKLSAIFANKKQNKNQLIHTIGSQCPVELSIFHLYEFRLRLLPAFERHACRVLQSAK